MGYAKLNKITYKDGVKLKIYTIFFCSFTGGLVEMIKYIYQDNENTIIEIYNPDTIEKDETSITMSKGDKIYNIHIGDESLVEKVYSKMIDRMETDGVYNIYGDLYIYYLTTDFDLNKVNIEVN